MTINKIIILGDVFFSNNNDKLVFFNKIKNQFTDCLVIANLEGSIKFEYDNSKNKAVHMSLPKFNPQEIPDNLFFSLVNNHVTDFGIQNFQLNLEHFGKKGLISTKEKISNIIGQQKFIFLADHKEQCLIKETNFLNFSNKTILGIANEINSAIVIVHGGIEFRPYPTPYQRNLARKIIGYGARKVIFHHSHTIGHYEFWNERLIHYGLGNAFFSDTLDIHSLDKSYSHGIISNEKDEIIKLNQLNIENFDNSHDTLNINKMSQSDYIKFYKKKYKLDSSFRPRQLSDSDLKVNIQIFFWSLIANFLVRIKLSKKLKSILKMFITKN